MIRDVDKKELKFFNSLKKIVFLLLFGAIHEPFPSFVSDTAKCYSKLKNSNSSHSLRACVAKPVGARSTVWEGADDGIKLKSSDCVTSQLAIGRNLPKKNYIFKSLDSKSNCLRVGLWSIRLLSSI